MGKQPSPKDRTPSLTGKTKAVTIGIVIAVIGCIISSSFAKDTITNYTGFGMLLTGLATSILAGFATVAATLNMWLNQEAPANINAGKSKLLFTSVWSIGVGVALAVTGSIIASAYEKSTLINNVGFWALLGGICVFVVGFFGTMLATVRTKISQNEPEPGASLKGKTPRFLYSGIAAMAVGTALTVIGAIIGRSYAKETILNYAGFGMQLAGIAALSICVTGIVATILKNRWLLKGKLTGVEELHVELGSIWAIGIGAMLVIIGSLLAGSYEKSSLMNYAGFGTLLAGTGVLVYGIFETARISVVGFLNRKPDDTLSPQEKWKRRTKEKLPERLKNAGRTLVATRAVFNVIGLMVAIGLLFFSLWQLDLIVSGPVWWEYSPDGVGWSWQGPGAYAKEFFQCFIWKTTIGQAYDTLFMLVFISFIIMFASAFFWPKAQQKTAKPQN
jgi:hypothetical protein